MKKLNELFFGNDRRKLIFSFTVTGTLLLLAALLPLCFRTEVSSEEPGPDPAARMKLFSCWWQQTAEACSEEKTESFGTETDSFCEKQMKRIIRTCLTDSGLRNPDPTGRERTILHGADGTELSLCRMWLEATGDWKNWLDVCFDAETGVPYYFYLSRERLSETGDAGAPGELCAETVAEELAESLSWSLYRLTESEDGAWDAVFGTGVGAACYRITVKAYENLIDVMFCCI